MPRPTAPPHVHSVFHRLWTTHVGTPGYDKTLWRWVEVWLAGDDMPSNPSKAICASMQDSDLEPTPAQIAVAVDSGVPLLQQVAKAYVRMGALVQHQRQIIEGYANTTRTLTQSEANLRGQLAECQAQIKANEAICERMRASLAQSSLDSGPQQFLLQKLFGCMHPKGCVHCAWCGWTRADDEAAAQVTGVVKDVWVNPAPGVEVATRTFEAVKRWAPAWAAGQPQAEEDAHLLATEVIRLRNNTRRLNQRNEEMASELVVAQAAAAAAKKNVQLATARRDDVWLWQESGGNEPKSLSVECPVVMSSTTLNLLLADRGETLERLAAEVTSLRKRVGRFLAELLDDEIKSETP